MKSLVISPEGPLVGEGAAAGGVHRLGLFVRATAAVSQQLEIIHFVPADADNSPERAAHLSDIESAHWGVALRVRLVRKHVRRETTWAHYGSGVLSLRGHPAFYGFIGADQASAIGRQIDAFQPDFVLAHRLGSIGALIRANRALPPTWFDLDDIEHRARIRAALAPPFRPGKAAYLAQTFAVHLAERRAIARAFVTSVCSESDREYMARLRVPGRLAVVPNAVKLPETVVRIPEQPTVLFLGNYRHPPNVEAVRRLLHSIWPRVSAAVPDAQLLIAGATISALPPLPPALSKVSYVGFVSDLGELYAASRLVVCPLSMGGGTRVKLVEAAGYGRPMVSTTIGAEGLEFVEGQDIVIRDRDDDFAEACIRLLRDSAACVRLGEAARVTALRVYERSIVEAKIGDRIRSVMRGVA